MSNFSTKIVKTFLQKRQPFLQKSSHFLVKIIKFSSKNHNNFPTKGDSDWRKLLSLQLKIFSHEWIRLNEAPSFNRIIFLLKSTYKGFRLTEHCITSRENFIPPTDPLKWFFLRKNILPQTDPWKWKFFSESDSY